MHILVTNDDGVHAEGIRVLALELEKLGKVTVVAPDRERSATGHAITMHHPLRVEEVKLAGTERGAYMVNGTPSDCVKLGIEALSAERVDLVVSGINRGPNLGTDVLYSGTVSGALEAAISGLPAFSISLAAHEEWPYEYAAKFARALAEEILTRRELPPGTLLNVNVPCLEPSEINGVKITRLGLRRYKKVFDQRIDPRGKTYYWLAGEVVDLDDDPDADTTAIRNNYISITPLYFDLTQHSLIPRLREWDLTRYLALS